MPIIEKAVIPVAGLGTRMLPLTKSVPKEMLPVGEKPMIQHAVEELASSGIKKICIVICPRKEGIKDYFLSKYAYKRDRSVEEVERLASKLQLSFVCQHAPSGLGDAILATRDFVDDNPFVMAIPDQILYSRKPATLQLLEYYRSNQLAIWSGLIKPALQEAPYFTEHRDYRLGEFHRRMCRIIELLPRIGEIRGFSRTILQPQVFHFLEGDPEYVSGFSECVKQVPHYGVFLEGIPFDFGTLEGYYRYLPRIWSLIKQEDSK